MMKVDWREAVLVAIAVAVMVVAVLQILSLYW